MHFARARGATVIEGQLAEDAFAEARKGMCPVDHNAGHGAGNGAGHGAGNGGGAD